MDRPPCLQLSGLPAPLLGDFGGALSAPSAGTPLASLRRLWLEPGAPGGVLPLSRAPPPGTEWQRLPFGPVRCCLPLRQQLALLSQPLFSVPSARGSMHGWFEAPLVPLHWWLGQLR
eukprot:scaffold126_cov315-Pavlova_lutheri.AAC.33